MSKRTRFLPILLCLLLVLPIALSACNQGGGGSGGGSSKTLNLFTWEGYISQDVINKFTDETGITVNFINFATNEEMIAKLQASSGGEYDVILASDVVLDEAHRVTIDDDANTAPLMQELDKSKIPNFSNIDPQYMNQFYDPDNKYTVPYVAGVPLIVYDPAKVDFEITGYEDLWDERLRDQVVVMDDMRNIMGITFKTLGGTLNETNPEFINASKEKLFALKPNLRAMDYETPHTKMLSGETTVGYMFTPFVAMVLDERPDFKVVYPKEGLGYGQDALFIPVGAPNPDNAHAFLDFLLRGDISAQCSEEQYYMNCNTAAREYLSQEFYDNKALYIPDEYLVGKQALEYVGNVISDYYLPIWTEFKQLP